MTFNRIHLYHPQPVPGQTITWETFPDELCETALTFLSEKELSKIKRVNRRMRMFVDLTVHFNRCWQHPQHQQKNSLSQHLINILMQNSSLRDDEGLGKIQAYFNEKFGQHTVNLLADYETLRNQLLIPRGLGPRWIDNQEVVEEYFYPFITSSMWVRNRCENLFSLAKKIRDVYHTVLSNQQERKKGNISESPVRVLPSSLPIQSYTCLHDFLRIAHAVEGLWSDIALLNSIISGPDRETIRHQNQSIDSIIISTFRNLKLTENITPSAILYLRNLRPYFFSTHLLVDDPYLFPHFNRLTAEELIFAVHYDSAELPDNSSLLKKVVGKEEIRKRLKSYHYAQLAYSPKTKFIGFSEAAAILSVAEVIAELTDYDLLILVDSCKDEIIPSLLNNNPALMNRMTGDLWFELVKNFGGSGLVSKHKAIYNLFSVDQLKYLVMKECKYHLLLDDDIYRKLKNVFTLEEIMSLKLRKSYLCSRILMLEEKDNIEESDEKTIFLKEENGSLIVYWLEGNVRTTHFLKPENSERLRYEFAQRKSLQEDEDTVLFNELISLCGYTSKISERIAQLSPQKINIDTNVCKSLPYPSPTNSRSNSTANLNVQSSFMQHHAAILSAQLTNTKRQSYPEIVTLTVLVSEAKPIPLGKKPGPTLLSPDKQPKCMKATLALASTLIIAGTGLGISAVFMPHLLTAAIAVLGSGLLVLGAHRVMKYSQQVFFSSRASFCQPVEQQQLTYRAPQRDA